MSVMRRGLPPAVFVLVSLFAVSCASNPGGSTGAMPLPQPVGFQEELPADKDDVVIYAYRLRSIVGAAVGWRVKIDGNPVGVLRNGTYLTMHTTPGTHIVVLGDSHTIAEHVIENATKDLNTLPMTGGNTYYYRGSGFKGYFVDKELAMQELARLRHIIPAKP